MLAFDELERFSPTNAASASKLIRVTSPNIAGAKRID
jgi:hypothetical protein